MSCESCSTCAISLTCYAGKLVDIQLCPLCGKLCAFINDHHHSIECPLRPCEQRIKTKWFEYYRCAYNNNAIGGLYMYTTEEDTGPSQQYYTYDDASILFIGLCDKCFFTLKQKSTDQQYDEINRKINK